MKVDYQKNDDGVVKDAEFLRVGDCIVLIVGDIQHRVALTKEQWKLLSESAAYAAQGG